MYLKKILTGLCSVALIGVLCACNSMQETNVTDTSAILTDAVETTANGVDTENTLKETTETEVLNDATENDTLTTISDEQAIVTTPDAAFLLELCNKWLSEDVLENGKSFMLDGTPTGTVTALYTDIDGDAVAEFCFIVDTYGTSALYVCDYINDAWNVVDILTIAKQYTYLQENGNGTTSLFAVVGVRSVEGLHSYVYNNGVEETFEMFDYTAFYDNELATAGDDTDRDNAYYKAIEDALAGYDNLTYLYDLPCVTENLVNDVRFIGSDFIPDGYDIDAVQDKFDTFTADVAALFKNVF